MASAVPLVVPLVGGVVAHEYEHRERLETPSCVSIRLKALGQSGSSRVTDIEHTSGT